MFKSLKYFKRKQKGQGIVEYALLLAFIVILAMMLNGFNLGSAIRGVFDSAELALANFENTYASYYKKWHDYSAGELFGIDNNERIKADQEGLALMARAFIGKTPDEALAQLKTFTDGNSAKNNSALPKDGNAEDGYSQEILVPLSYYDYFDQSDYIKLERNQSQNTVKYLASDAEVYDKKKSPVSNTTIAKDRIFYSNDMIGSTAGEQRTISARLNYKNGVVESVDITARQGNYKGQIAEGLNLNVTRSSYTVNDNDYVINHR